MGNDVMVMVALLILAILSLSLVGLRLRVLRRDARLLWKSELRAKLARARELQERLQHG